MGNIIRYALTCIILVYMELNTTPHITKRAKIIEAIGNVLASLSGRFCGLNSSSSILTFNQVN